MTNSTFIPISERAPSRSRQDSDVRWKMNRYALVGMWIVALLISGWLFQFALSDFYWPKPRRMFEAPDYVQEGNPFRPIFRACFGVVMITLVMIAAIVVTARAKSR